MTKYSKNHPGPPNPPPGLEPYHCGWYGHLTRNCPVNRGGCGRHFKKGEPDYDNPYCPDCGTHRYCLRRRNTGMTVCAMHGGGSPNKGRPGGLNKSKRGNHKGRFARILVDTNYYEEYEKGLADPRYLELKEQIALARSRHVELVRRMADEDLSRDSSEAWREMEKLTRTALSDRQTIVNVVAAMVRAYNAKDAEGAKRNTEKLIEAVQDRSTLERLNQVAREGLGDWALKKDQREEEDHYRRLCAEERKLYVDSHRMVKLEKMDLLLQMFLNDVDRIVSDPEKMVAIGWALKNLLSGESKPDHHQNRVMVPVLEGSYESRSPHE